MDKLDYMGWMVDQGADPKQVIKKRDVAFSSITQRNI